MSAGAQVRPVSAVRRRPVPRRPFCGAVRRAGPDVPLLILALLAAAQLERAVGR